MQQITLPPVLPTPRHILRNGNPLYLVDFMATREEKYDDRNWGTAFLSCQL